MPKKLWYVLAVQTGKEKFLRRQITKKARIKGIDEIGRILIPTHPVEKMRSGQPQIQNRKAFPGYLIVHMTYCEDTHTLIEQMESQGVFGLLPLIPKDNGFKHPKKEPRQKRPMEQWEKEVRADWFPTALQSEEAARLHLMKKVKNKTKEVVKDPCPFVIGEKVKILSGMFQDQIGQVKNIRETQDDYTIVVEIILLGRKVTTASSHRNLEKV